MRTLQHIISRLFAAIVFASMNFQLASATPLMIVGNDEKLLWDDDGKRVLFPAGKDSVMISIWPILKTRKLLPICRSRIRSSGRPSMWRSIPLIRSRW
jgi:hypothetical protein